MAKGNLGQFVLETTQSYRELPAFILKEPNGSRRPLSFFEFNELVLKISQIFRMKYQTPGFKIGLWGENRVEWCALALATWHAGGVLVPLMHIATEGEVRNIIGAAGIDGLFISPKLFKEGNFGAKETFGMDFNQSRNRAASGWKTLGDLLNELRFVPQPVGSKQILELLTEPDDLAVLIFTSGTTGRPKGVMLSHRNIITNILDTAPLMAMTKNDRMVSVLPLSHMFELTGGFTISHLKGVCISYPDSLKPDDVLSEMRIHKATWLVAVPLFFEIIDRNIQEQLKKLSPVAQRALASFAPAIKQFPFLGKVIFRKVHDVFGGHIRFFVSGGARIDPDIIARFQNLGIRMLQGYGLTETSPIVSFTNIKSECYGSVGQLVSSLKIRIDSPNENGEGEICIAGPSVFKGYFNNPEATDEVLKDGWFHTGDVGRLNEDGFIFITGRKKDIIVTPNGKNVYPEELEEALKTSPLLLEVAVIGLDTGKGEEVHAVVVPSAQVPTDPQARKQAVWNEAERLTADFSDYKRIQGITISEQELPKTPTKKVRKHLLKDMIKTGAFGNQGTQSVGPHTPLDKRDGQEAWLQERLMQISKKDNIWREAHLRHDLGIDSLTFMEVIGLLESHWGVRIPDENFEKIQTVENLLTALESGATVSQGTSVSSESQTKTKEFNYKSNNTLLMNALRIFVHGILIRPFMRLFFKLRILNRTVLERNKNFVITPNHASHLDLLSILSSVPLNMLNKTYAVAADDYFFDKKLKALFVRIFFNAIPFERRARIDKGFKVCEDILQAGGNLIIFPEGTRSPTGQLGQFKPGVGRLLAAQGYLAIPIFIYGAYNAFPKGASFPRPNPIAVYIGQPQVFLAQSSTNEGYQQVAVKLQKEVEELRDRAITRGLDHDLHT